MSIKDFYEIANKINFSKQTFEHIGTMTSAIEYAQKAMFPYWNDYYKHIIPQINMIKEITTPYIMQLTQNQARITKILAPQLELFAKQQQIFNNIAPQIALASEAMKPYLELRERLKEYDFGAISKKWAQIAEVITKQRVNSILLDDYWIIIDDNLFSELKEQYLNDKFDANKHIVSYYSKHKFANIELVLEQIKECDCLKSEQIKIFEDCYTVMKKLSCRVACNTLIPTLTAQSDGLLNAICNIIPEEDKKAIMKEKEIKESSTASIILCYLESLTIHGTTEKFKIVIKEKAFGKQKKNATYQKSRHKILHGKCDYGSKENLVRCWLEIAFLIKVYCLILIKQQEKEVA